MPGARSRFRKACSRAGPLSNVRERSCFKTSNATTATCSEKKEANEDPDALNGMLAAIDQGTKDSVYVMVVEDGNDIAGMGGLMGTAMYSREYAGAVIDGGVRDVAGIQLKRTQPC